jgi:hypothetical protein
LATWTLNGNNFGAPPPGGGGDRPSFLERLFDEHSDGRFVKYLLIVMLLIATVTQPWSIIYTAYGNDLPTTFWQSIPALALLLFIALDWTILPLGYFFATTAKPGLKIVLALLLAVVAFGAFEGYFTATERLVSMRIHNINAISLDVEHAQAEVDHQKAEREEMLSQQSSHREQVDKQRANLKDQAAQIDREIATAQAGAQAEEAHYPEKIAEITKACKIVSYVCIGPQLTAAADDHKVKQADFAHELEKLHAEKAANAEQLAGLIANDDSKVGPANQAVEEAEKRAGKERQTFKEAVLGSQVYRWAGVLYGVSPDKVTAEEATRVLDIFAAAVALAYVLTQIVLSISFYGRHRPGVIETNRELLRERVNHAWELVISARRAYWARKRRGVYRDRIKEVPVTEYRDREVTKEVFVPTAERTKVIYVPVPPGGPVPPAEEFVRKANFEGTL